MSVPLLDLDLPLDDDRRHSPAVATRRRIVIREEAPRTTVPYLVRPPATGVAVGGTLVVVHGISRNSEDHVAVLCALADELRLNIVAPWFRRKRFNGYQRLLCRGGQRADLALLAVIADAEQILGPTHGLHLYGFSGGAQFAHRFALCHPQGVRSVFLTAAGHYTFPTLSMAYPFGLRLRHPHRALELDLESYLRLPTTIAVGDRDRLRDPSLHVDPKLDREQGSDRFERGRRFTLALNACAGALGIPLPARFAVLGGADHNLKSCIEGGLVRRLREHLLRAITWPPEL